MKIGLIGGSGLSKNGIEKEKRNIKVDTKYGEVEVFEIIEDNFKVYFLPRHGLKHSFPPHLVPYRANISALKKIGVERIIATSAVGSINDNYKPATLILSDQFIDFTKKRNYTFSSRGEVLHVDVTYPFCPDLQGALLEASENLNKKIISGATCVVTEGPRFETPAEIKAFKMLGGDLVGMTLIPECVLAREVNICYANLSIVTNYAAGISDKKLTAKEVEDLVEQKKELIIGIIFESFKYIPERKNCNCGYTKKDATV